MKHWAWKLPHYGEWGLGFETKNHCNIYLTISLFKLALPFYFVSRDHMKLVTFLFFTFEIDFPIS